MLERNKSTISREIRRNPSRDKGYKAVGAQRKYHTRRKRCMRKRILGTNEETFRIVCEGLNQYWSPEQISNTLPRHNPASFSTIYRAIKSKLIPKEFCIKLRRYGKLLKHRKSRREAYDFSLVRTIAERPTAVDHRNRYGTGSLTRSFCVRNANVILPLS